MLTTSDAFLRKAQESLDGASSELANGRYNNAANRMYYACFQAAIAALVSEAIQPQGRADDWSHRFVQSQFAGILIARRKRYSSALRDVLAESQSLREQADYQEANVSQRQASQMFRRVRTFVNAVQQREKGDPS